MRKLSINDKVVWPTSDCWQMKGTALGPGSQVFQRMWDILRGCGLCSFTNALLLIQGREQARCLQDPTTHPSNLSALCLGLVSQSLNSLGIAWQMRMGPEPWQARREPNAQRKTVSPTEPACHFLRTGQQAEAYVTSSGHSRWYAGSHSIRAGADTNLP